MLKSESRHQKCSCENAQMESRVLKYSSRNAARESPTGHPTPTTQSPLPNIGPWGAPAQMFLRGIRLKKYCGPLYNSLYRYRYCNRQCLQGASHNQALLINLSPLQVSPGGTSKEVINPLQAVTAWSRSAIDRDSLERAFQTVTVSSTKVLQPGPEPETEPLKPKA